MHERGDYYYPLLAKRGYRKLGHLPALHTEMNLSWDRLETNIKKGKTFTKKSKAGLNTPAKPMSNTITDTINEDTNCILSPQLSFFERCLDACFDCMSDISYRLY